MLQPDHVHGVPGKGVMEKETGDRPDIAIKPPTLFIGGRAATAYASLLEIAGIHTLDTLSALRTGLETLRAGKQL